MIKGINKPDESSSQSISWLIQLVFIKITFKPGKMAVLVVRNLESKTIDKYKVYKEDVLNVLHGFGLFQRVTGG